MGGLIKGIFGGTDKSSQKAQIDANAQDRQLFEKLANESSGSAKSLFGSADTNRNSSLQQVLSLLGGTIPQQLSARQQGNTNAQQQLIGGLPMIQAALMGRPINMSGLQPSRVSYDAGFAKQALPQFQSSAQALAPPPKAEQPSDLSTILSQIQTGKWHGSN